MLVVAAIIERDDGRILIAQRRRTDTSPLKWEFPGGKVRAGEALQAALARELHEELGVTMARCREIVRLQHTYATLPEPLDIVFFAASLKERDLYPSAFEQVVWALPRDLGGYDFLAANAPLIANLAAGRIKPAEILADAEAP